MTYVTTPHMKSTYVQSRVTKLTYHNTTSDQSHSVRGEIADLCCPLVNHK